ncbi:MAG: glycosyltransferase family 2 protein [Phocaeicola sp.]|nr:glycosyltransferase family 2 protein [Phocaeicola sp.]
MKLSFIIPCYNAESFITRCIESININLSYEIIAIDDGSTDNTLNVLKDIASQNNNLKIISKQNEGVLAARRDGWRASIGEYVCFIDADDEIDGASLYKIIQDYTGFDMIRCGITCKTNGIIKSEMTGNFKGYISNAKDLAIKMMNKELLPFMCGVLYKRTLLEEKCFLLDQRFKIGEDLLFNAMTIRRISSTYCTEKCYYYYNNNSTSVMNTKIWGSSYIRDFNDVLKNILISISPQLIYYSDRHRFADYINTLFFPEISYDKELYKEALNLLKEHPEFINILPSKRRLFLKHEKLFRTYLYLWGIYKRNINKIENREVLQ